MRWSAFVRLMIGSVLGGAVLLGQTYAYGDDNIVLMQTDTPLARVYFVPDPEEDQLFGELIVHRGEADMSGPEGIAHYLEHLVALNALPDRDKQWQRDFNASTTKTYSNYHMSSHDDDQVMRYLAGVFAPISVDHTYLREEASIVRNEYSQRIGENQYYPLLEAFNRTLYQGTGLTRSVIGKPDEILTFDPELAIAAKRAHYHPASADLLLRGNMSEEEAQTLVSEYFGRIQTDENNSRALASQQFFKHKTQRLRINNPHIAQGTEVAVILMSGAHTDEAPAVSETTQSALHSMVSALLSSHHQSMFARMLIDDRKDYASVGGFFRYFPGRLGYEFRLWGDIRDGKRPAFLVESLTDWLATVEKSPDILLPAMHAKLSRLKNHAAKRKPVHVFYNAAQNLKDGYSKPIKFNDYVQALEALTPDDVIGYLQGVLKHHNDISHQFYPSHE